MEEKNWEELLHTENMDDLKAAKLWLFQENMRLMQAYADLEEERSQFEQSRDKFLRERAKHREEMERSSRRAAQERKRLKEDNLFFEKKMAILQDGFRQLEEDRKKFEQEKGHILDELDELREETVGMSAPSVAHMLFRRVTNPLALRKRYRDLTKIFHPDNYFGDEELMQQINREYLQRRREEIG